MRRSVYNEGIEDKEDREMKKTHEWTSARTGDKTTVEIEYTKTVREIVLDADGVKIETGKNEIVETMIITASVNGQIVARSTSGYMVCNPEASKAIIALIDECKAEETAEVAEVKAAEKAEEVAEAQEIVAAAEKQTTIPTAAQYREFRRRYNEIHNEGAEGYIPTMITKEQYEAAKAIINR
jgi:hypothetical protein